MKVFPLFLLRISGETYDSLDSLNFKEIDSSFEKLSNLIQKQKLLNIKICDDLYHKIKDCNDKKCQNELLNFKRDFFNNRILLTNPIVNLEEFDITLRQTINEYFEISEKIQVTENLLNNIYQFQTPIINMQFKELVNSDVLQRGLLMSSKSLLNRLEHFKKNNYLNSKQNLKTEISIIKYLSRMCIKTSPFSTFTNLSIGRFHFNKHNLNDLKLIKCSNGDDFVDYSKKSRIRLNNTLFLYIRDFLFKNKLLSKNIAVRLNPTINKKHNNFEYLINSNNIETFMQIGFNDVLKYILKLTKSKRVGIKFKTLLSKLYNLQIIDAPKAELQDYLYSLIEFGFLEFNIQISGKDPDWDSKLIDKLLLLYKDNVIIDNTVTALKSLKELSLKYELANLSERIEIHDKAVIIASNILKEHKNSVKDQLNSKEEAKFKELQNTPSKSKLNEKATEYSNSFFKNENIFYEDTYADLQLSINGHFVSKSVECLDDLLKRLLIFEPQIEEMEKMKLFFAKKYGSIKEVELLTFYRDYFELYKKSEIENEDQLLNDDFVDGANKEIIRENLNIFKENNPFYTDISHASKQLVEMRETWCNRFKEEICCKLEYENDIVNISKKDIERLEINEQQFIDQNYRTSYGMFVQLFQDNNVKNYEVKDMIIINSIFPGYGKLFGRFLYLFDEKITKTIRKWNIESFQNCIPVENCDASIYNVNVHPLLLPAEIWMPGSNNAVPPNKQISVSDIRIRLDQKTKKLILVDSLSKKQLFVLDLGFQGHRGRSHLYKLLDKFTSCQYTTFNVINNIINGYFFEKNSLNNNKVIRRPRIVYEKQIVLQRRIWLVKKQYLPIKNKGETDSQYFVKLNKWRIGLEIPTEVFIYISLHHLQNHNSSLNQQTFSRDDYKPQYISFSNHFLVKLFEKKINRVLDFLKIEEMLPGSGHLFKHNKKQYATEFLIQWYS